MGRARGERQQSATTSTRANAASETATRSDDFVRSLPTTALPELFHIGRLDASDKTRFSYEGHGLSVSRDPEEWQRIARLGGHPWWQIQCQQGQFLNYHELDTTQREHISAWGVSAGWVERTECYAYSYYDEELEDETTIQFATRAEAESEAELDDGPDDPTEVRVEQTLRGTALLAERIQMDSDGSVFEHLLALWVEEKTELDGVWYEDDYGHISAPRGVIAPRALARWQKKQIV